MYLHEDICCHIVYRDVLNWHDNNHVCFLSCYNNPKSMVVLTKRHWVQRILLTKVYYHYVASEGGFTCINAYSIWKCAQVNVHACFKCDHTMIMESLQFCGVPSYGCTAIIVLWVLPDRHKVMYSTQSRSQWLT